VENKSPLGKEEFAGYSICRGAVPDADTPGMIAIQNMKLRRMILQRELGMGREKPRRFIVQGGKERLDSGRLIEIIPDGVEPVPAKHIPAMMSFNLKSN
jgi:hypothetical protein